jgi:hypothetical protein
MCKGTRQKMENRWNWGKYWEKSIKLGNVYIMKCVISSGHFVEHLSAFLWGIINDP